MEMRSVEVFVFCCDADIDWRIGCAWMRIAAFVVIWLGGHLGKLAVMLRSLTE